MNAIILAAGKSKRFAPFTYEKPKGLFRVKGEILIERQIEQLRDAGIKDIYVVVGFMKEKFFYLEEQFGVKLLINNTYNDKGNIYSLYVAREYLEDSYICCADHYFVNNPFSSNQTNSIRACVVKKGKFREFAVNISDNHTITDMSLGGESSMCMVGYAFFNKSFSKTFISLLEKEINDFGIANMFWEEYYYKHITQLTLVAKIYNECDILEFDSVEDLIQFDQDFLNNIDSKIVKNICKCLGCKPVEITNIKVIEKGLTNVSFQFNVNDQVYVYRHPGGTSNNLVDRKSELFAQNKAKEIGIDNSLIHMDIEGWKISYFISDTISVDYTSNNELMDRAMRYLRELHSVQFNEYDLKKFDTYKEALKLMQIASATKGDLKEEFNELLMKMKELNDYLNKDNANRVLCHNDTYSPNYLYTKDDSLYLIDWEYAGINDPANDLGCILCRSDYSNEQINKYLNSYFGREMTEKERMHFIAYISLSGFYWFCWGLYKGSVNDDDGFFMLPAYKNCIRFLDVSLDYYKKQ